MTTETFKASVQYNDWKGMAAADSSHQNDFDDWLKKNGKKKPEEFLIGIEIRVGENHEKHKDPVSVTFLLALASEHGTVKEEIESGKPLQVQRITEDMNLIEFFGMFKRFNIAISKNGMLTDRQYSYLE